MAVILPNATLAVGRKTHPFARDAHGSPISGPDTVQYGQARPAGLLERADVGAEQGTDWSIRLAPEEWPVRAGDHVTDGTDVWVVTASRLHRIVGHPDVDYVAVTAYREAPTVP